MLGSIYRAAEEHEEIPFSTLVLALPHWVYFSTTTDIVKFILSPLVLCQEESDELLLNFILRIKHLLPSPVPNLGRRDARLQAHGKRVCHKMLSK